jgi:hypothetical protein
MVLGHIRTLAGGVPLQVNTMTPTLPTPEGPVALEPSGDIIQVVLQEPTENKVTTWTREDRDALLEGDTVEIPHPDHILPIDAELTDEARRLIETTLTVDDDTRAEPRDVPGDRDPVETPVKVTLVEHAWDASTQTVTIDADEDLDDAVDRALEQAYIDVDAEQVRETIEDALAEHETQQQRQHEREAERQAALTEAQETGERVAIETGTVPCDGSAIECDLDRVTRYATPEGEIETERIHLH